MHAFKNGGNVLVRFHSTNLPLFTHRVKPFPILEKLRSLNKCTQGDWNVWFFDPDDNTLVKGRLFLRKSKESIALAKKKILQDASKRYQKPLARVRVLVYGCATCHCSKGFNREGYHELASTQRAINGKFSKTAVANGLRNAFDLVFLI